VTHKPRRGVSPAGNHYNAENAADTQIDLRVCGLKIKDTAGKYLF
jgi:hypothetical protein